MEIVAFDKPIPAEKALPWGLVTELAEDGQVLEVAKDMAHRFRESSLLAFSVCKRLMLNSFHRSLEAQLENERVGISRCVSHGDGEEGILAFLEKRKPVFKHK
jgi:2-(1,2-epoxy-1,2-dihydrophenyl)acetyl-CoA isomerase